MIRGCAKMHRYDSSQEVFNMELTINVLLMLACAVLGTFSHWAKKSWRDGMPGNPIDYLMHQPYSTLAMFGTTFAACAAVGVTGQLSDASPWMAVALGFTTGYTADSALNKGPTK